jgi:hypothetical protein
VAGDGHKTSTFKNVARHNGLEAWRQIALPINEDKVLILQELLPLITNPRSASNIDHYDDAVREWTTNLTLFKEAGGQPPTGDAQRLAFTKLLPHDVAAHVTLHMNLPQYRDFHELRKFTDNYVKVMTSLYRQRKGVKSSAPVRLVEAFNGQMEEDGWAIEGEEQEEEDFVYPALDGLDVEQRVEVLAFMKARGFTPAGRGAGGRFQQRPGGRGQPQLANGPARAMPPRGRADMTCVNCNRKGHAASECRQPKREKHERLCFTCNKPGHEARNCPEKPAPGARPAIKAIEDGGPARRVAVMAITNKPCVQQS